MQFIKPPLPFMGNKRNQRENIIETLEIMQANGNINSETIFIDVFGGSGFISQICKTIYPQNRVIWNDYDNYQERLDHINETAELFARLAEYLYSAGVQLPLNAKYPEHHKQALLSIIRDHEEAKGYVDYITIGAGVLFGGAYAKSYEELEKQHFYVKHLFTNPPKQTNYLKGVERVSLDFEELLNTYKHTENTLSWTRFELL